MAELEARIADREQAHRMETMSKLAGHTEGQMIAMQATDLASKEHGGAFADALGKLVDGEQARKRAGARRSGRERRDEGDAGAREDVDRGERKAGGAGPARPVLPGMRGRVEAGGAVLRGVRDHGGLALRPDRFHQDQVRPLVPPERAHLRLEPGGEASLDASGNENVR